jgi:malonate-semialdehyde dehydrogenase (acetylating)/methylmalonate-semialdehyde dehydrogenase
MIPHWINGQRVLVAAGRHAEVFNPATGVATGRVPLASAAEAQAAVAVALAAWPAWRDTPALRRARVLFRFRELVERHREELARLITAEHGKTLGDAAGSIQRGLEVIEFACGIPQLLQGEASREVGTGIDCQSLREPLGVCAGITPFNFPAMVPLWMFPVAIACGNSFVLKPSERTPSCAVRLAELMGEAGLPPGVLNVLHGDREAVDELLCHPDVAAVSFVGSTPVARHVYAGCAQAGKRVQALGGAKNHLLVMPDADMALAADALVGAAYGSAGERCMAISVAVAVGGAGDALRAALLPRISALRLGPGTQADVDVGPLITAQHLERVRGYIAAGEAEGAELVVDGRIAADRSPALSGGYFLGPTLFDHASSAMRIWREEIFGPLLIIVRVATPADALALVNQHEFANGAAIFTRDGRLARECAARLDVGMVGINVPIPVPAAFFSFGGRRSSFFGDSNVHGVEGVRFYTQIKTITSRWPHSGEAGDGKLDMPTL